MQHQQTSNARRIAAITTAIVLTAFVGCSQVGDAIGERAISMAEGSWTCTSSGDDDVVHLSVDGDGRFEVVEPDEEKPDADDAERAEGSWEVVDQDIELSLGGTVARVIDGEGFSLDAGTITLEVPSMERRAEPGETEMLPFDVSVEGRSTVTITPVDHAAERYPSGPILCERD